MDHKAGFFSDLKGTRNSSVLCFRATMTTSSGIWLHEHPLDFSFPLFLVQLSIIFVSCHLVQALLRPIGLPQVISHTIAGIILGPTCLSRNHIFQETIFPLRSWVHLDLAAQLAFVLFIFVIGVETDLSLIRRSGRNAFTIAVVGTILPYITIIASAVANTTISEDSFYSGIVIRMARRWAVSSNTVISCLLAEFNLLTSSLGRLAISASLIAEFLIVVSTVIFNSIFYSSSFILALASLFSFGALILFIWIVAHPFAVWMVRRTPVGATVNESFFIFVVVLALASSVAGELVGETLMSGPLLFGLLLPSGPPLGTTLVDRILSLGSHVFLPVFFAVAGLRTNLYDLAGGSHMKWSRTAYLIAFGVVTKFTGVMLPCLYNKMPFREAFILALMLNSHGAVEIFSFNSWEDFKQADGEIYAMNILALIIIGGATGTLLKALYGTQAHLLPVRRRRTVQGAGVLGELRVLTCIHVEGNVPPLLALINFISPTAIAPLCIYLLHLSPLAGQSNSTLIPYKDKKKRKGASFTFKSLSTGSVSDRIVNSFRELEKQNPQGQLSILPFIGISPYATMHDDISSLAVEKLVDLILLPFHCRISQSGIFLPDSVKPDVRAVNANILLYSPCTIGILVDRGFNNRSPHRVAAFFIGGGDDREVLALATRMVKSHSIEQLIVVRFLQPKDKLENMLGDADVGEGDEELDDEAMQQFIILHDSNETVRYEEEEVSDGAETVAIIRAKSTECGLIMVGRGEGRASRWATSGLETWSEFPELGIVGDMITSPDFGGKASVLVVQHPATAGSGGPLNVSKVASIKNDKYVVQEGRSQGLDLEFGNEGNERLIQDGNPRT